MDSGGQMDMQELLAAAQQMQDELLNAQRELADAEVEGTSGGGLVTARVNGQGELVDLSISPAAIDVTDPSDTAQTLADLVLAAVRDAYRGVADLQQEKMGPLAGALGGGGGVGGGPASLPSMTDLFGRGAGGSGGTAPETGEAGGEAGRPGS